MGGGWGSTAEQQPHAVDEFRACTKSLNNSEMTPGYIYEMFDTRQAREEECAPWYANIRPGKMPFIKYQEAAMGALPSNWVAVGDAVMKVNPIYGTGCTKAMMDVVTLDSLLHRVPSQQDLAPGFRTSRNTKANNYGWSTTDLARGETLATGAGLRKFSRYLLYAGQQNHCVRRRFIRAQFYLIPRTDLFAPSVPARVAWRWLRT